LLPEEIDAAIAAFQIEETRISLKDLTAEEAQAELAAVFSSIFDGLAGEVVPFIEQFQQVGEGLGETLVRVATGVQVVQAGMEQLGFSLDELDPEAFAQVSEGLLDLTGGIEGFIDGMSTFVNAFATEEHKFTIAQDAITSAFEQVGLVVPETRDAMWELMQSLDATTEEGREQIATLLRLAGVADQYYNLLEDREEDAADAAEDLANELLDLIAAQEEYAALVNNLREELLDVGLSPFQLQVRDIGEWAAEAAEELNKRGDCSGSRLRR
jgi:vacuolar-type H+-ATPase subunit F/Vma7